MDWKLEILSKDFAIPQEVVELFEKAEACSAEPGGWEGHVIEAVQFCRRKKMPKLANKLALLV